MTRIFEAPSGVSVDLLWNYLCITRARAIFGARDEAIAPRVCRVIADEISEVLTGEDPAAHIKAALEAAQAAAREGDEGIA